MPIFLVDGQWTKRTPPEVFDGCFVYPAAVPILKSFKRLSRGRTFSAFGQAMPLTYRDVRDEAARCRSFLDADTIEQIFILLDDQVLKWAADDNRSSRDDQQRPGENRGGPVQPRTR